MTFKDLLVNFKSISWKPILIPPEHGIWGLTLEAAILGFCFSIKNNFPESTWLLFLLFISPFAKQSLRTYLMYALNNRESTRKTPAFWVSVGFGFLYAMGIVMVYVKSNQNFFVWLVVAFLLAFVLVSLEAKGFIRNLFIELFGSFIPVLFAMSMNSIHEFPISTLSYIFIGLAFRNISSILLIRDLLNLLKNREFQLWSFLVILISFAGLSLFLFMFEFYNQNIFFILLIYLVSFLGVYFLIVKNKISKPQSIGFLQLFLGISYVVCLFFFN